MSQADLTELKRGSQRTEMLSAYKRAELKNKQKKQLTPAMELTVIKTSFRLLHKILTCKFALIKLGKNKCNSKEVLKNLHAYTKQKFYIHV